MNLLEKEMLEILRKCHQEYNIIAVKSSFEDEGSTLDECFRLSELASQSRIDMALKIGGCEAISDLYNAKQLGVKYVVAPMIESSYALQKFIKAKQQVFSSIDAKLNSFLFNIETTTGLNNIDHILEIALGSKEIDGIIFGRDDYSNSLGNDLNSVESKILNESVESVSRLCLKNNLIFILGGGITFKSILNLEHFKKIYLSRFETRKIVFDSSIIQTPKLSYALHDAIYFELLWLKNKSFYHPNPREQDLRRIEKLEAICSES